MPEDLSTIVETIFDVLDKTGLGDPSSTRMIETDDGSHVGIVFNLG